jgi:multidrug efflux pump subunit AcrB
VINFQNWIDPLIVLMAVHFALGGVMCMLFLTQADHVPAAAQLRVAAGPGTD